jgi:hypothetical protein
MTWNFIVPTLVSNIWKFLVFYGYFESMGPLYKPCDHNFKRINFKLKIYRALKYIALNTLVVDSPTFTQKPRYFAMWRKNVKF